jgi:isopenicillin-N N-acyltransferase-like protein
MNSSIRLLELKGSSQKIGRSHGEACGDEIRELIQLLWENLSAYCPLALSRKAVLKMNMKNLPFTEEYGPDLVEEMRGVAEGAGVDFEEVFFLNSAFNLINLGDIKSVLPLLGCTAFGVSTREREDKKVYIGENYDIFKFFERFTLLLKIHDMVHPPALIYTIPGSVGQAGMNGRGIGVNVNYLCANDAQFGRIPAVIIRKVLQSERIGDAVAAIITGRRASGANYVIGDGEGNIFTIETSCGSYDILPSPHGVIGHANHYRSPPMRQYQVDRPNLIGDSIVRDYRMNRLLQERRESIDLNQLLEILKDHTNFPSSICFHGRGKEATSDGDVSTVVSMIQELNARTLYMCNGLPCKQEFSQFSVE